MSMTPPTGTPRPCPLPWTHTTQREIDGGTNHVLLDADGLWVAQFGDDPGSAEYTLTAVNAHAGLLERVALLEGLLVRACESLDTEGLDETAANIKREAGL
jgi:hypothetical protein